MEVEFTAPVGEDAGKVKVSVWERRNIGKN